MLKTNGNKWLNKIGIKNKKYLEQKLIDFNENGNWKSRKKIIWKLIRKRLAWKKKNQRRLFRKRNEWKIKI